MPCKLLLGRRVPILILAVATPSPLLTAQTTAINKPAPTNPQLHQTIKDWASKNQHAVTIEAPAAGHLEAAITPDKFRNAPTSAAAPSGGDFVVKSYLYELRDKKYAEMGSPALLGDTKVKLSVDDLQRFSFESYVDSFSASILRDPGEITVTSSPPGAPILIDNTPRGMTDKDFIVSKGHHLIVVKAGASTCTETIEVKDDPVPFRCPKQ